MKDHEIAQFVNELTEIAMKYHSMKQLRQRISEVVVSKMERTTEKEDEYRGG